MIRVLLLRKGQDWGARRERLGQRGFRNAGAWHVEVRLSVVMVAGRGRPVIGWWNPQRSSPSGAAALTRRTH
jgi:hypothetical protein